MTIVDSFKSHILDLACVFLDQIFPIFLFFLGRGQGSVLPQGLRPMPRADSAQRSLGQRANPTQKAQ